MTYRIAAVLKAEDNPFWSIEMRKGLEEASKEFHDVNLLYKSPEKISQVSS